MFLWFVFCVSGKVAKVLNMLVIFPSLRGLCGVAYSCLFVLRKFRCFCVSCFCFLLIGFVLFCNFVLFSCWIVFGVVLVFCCFLFVVVYMLFVFFESLRVR